jgi:diacylglycerol kinase (ATP)
MIDAKNFHPKPYLIINPNSGNADPQSTADIFISLCEEQNLSGDVFVLDGQKDLTQIASTAVDKGFNVIMAAGGDGTLSAVANGIIGKDAVLAIVPMGTGNGLAKALEIPLDAEKAIGLLGHDYQIDKMDVLEVDGNYAILNVSSGISARAMEETDKESKKSGGMLAYIQSFAQTMQELSTYRFHLCVDGKNVAVDASEVILSNGSLMSDPPFDIYGKRADFFDSQMEIQIIQAGRLDEYIALAWDMLVDDHEKADDVKIEWASHNVSIRTENGELRVQMDGDVRGKLPITVRFHPALLPVLLPLET